MRCSSMNTATFDTLAAARALEAAGMDAPQADAVVETRRVAVVEGGATKADLDVAVAEMKATLYRSLLIHGTTMAALLLGLRLFA